MDFAQTTVYSVGNNEDYKSQISESIAKMRIPHQEFQSIESLIACTNASSRGCVVANLRLFGIGGFDLLTQMKARRNTLPVIILSNQISTRMVVRAMREGAATVLELPVSDDDFFFAVRDAIVVNERRIAEAEEVGVLRAQFAELSQGEQQVLDHVCAGLNNKEIALELGVHVRTVEARKKRLLVKTQCKSFVKLLINYQGFRLSCCKDDDVRSPTKRLTAAVI